MDELRERIYEKKENRHKSLLWNIEEIIWNKLRGEVGNSVKSQTYKLVDLMLMDQNHIGYMN